SEELTRAGPAALPLLRAALREEDPEVVRRAEHCLERIEREADADRILAAARVLADRRPPGAAAALFAYLPASHGDEVALEGLLAVLTRLAADAPEPPAALTDGLRAADPLRRALAARALAASRPDARAAVRALLADPDASVRFTAAYALARAGDPEAVPALIALLEDGPAEYAYLCEDLLCRLRGGETPPRALGRADAEARRGCRAAWEEWWRAHAGEVDLAVLNGGEPLKGLTLIAEVDNNRDFDSTSGRVWECGRDGKMRWELTGLGGPVDVQVLPGSRLLIAEYYARRVTERDRRGHVLWDSGPLSSNPVSCQRLAGGNTLIATMTELIELTPERKRVGSFPAPPGPVFQARRARDGHTFFLCNGHVTELDARGKELRRVNVGRTSGWAGLEVLPNGNFLVAQYTAAPRVAEVDGDGKVVWECTTPLSPTRAQRLRSGNTLVAGGNHNFVAEYNPAGEEVWRAETKGRPFAVLRY
ncbi:MAG TPA: HEAT repeat domain-containing protein, partial [Gemmataceae bacterium]